MGLLANIRKNLKKSSTPDTFSILRERFGNFWMLYSVGDLEFNSGNADLISAWAEPSELIKGILSGQFSDSFEIQKDYFSLFLLELRNGSKRFAVVLDRYDPWLNPTLIATADATDMNVEMLKTIYPSIAVFNPISKRL